MSTERTSIGSGEATGATDADISFELNGETVRVTAGGAERLSRVLRETLGKTGTKIGCDAGDCGACSVLLDDAVVCACMVPLGRVAGARVTTVEGLAGHSQRAKQLQESMLEHGAAQCGICTPGVLVAATALLERISAPTTADIEQALGGVLCRCTGYRKIINAVEAVTEGRVNRRASQITGAVGEAVTRLDGLAKVTGTDAFGADLIPNDALTLRAVRSPYHHASVEFGDLDAFVANTPGIELVLTATDVPGAKTFGVIPQFRDQPVFADGHARFQGEVVAAVVGETAAIDALDEASVPIRFTELPAVLSASAARQQDAPQLHAEREGNLLTGGLVERGSLSNAFEHAAHHAAGEFETGFVEHAYIEPEAGFARREGNRIEIFGCTQAPHMDREEIARILDLSLDAVRIRPSAVGGGFGSKLDLSFQPLVALAAWRLGRPVRTVYSRPESMAASTKRHPAHIRARAAADAEGRLLALDFSGEFNTGAYASWGPTVANRVPVHASGPYFIPAYRARSRAILTHCAPAGAFRGFGVPQSAIALEILLDDLALSTAIDRLEFRRLNALANGQPTVTGQSFQQGVGIRACFDALKSSWSSALAGAAEFNQQTRDARRRGVGVAACWYGCGNTSLPNPSTIRLGIRRDGKIVLYQGAVDIGQGSNTVIAQICAEALGLPLDSFVLVDADTDRTPDAGKTSASRQTFVSGKAACEAGTRLREQILAAAGRTEPDALNLDGATLQVGASAIDLSRLPADDEGLVFVVEGHFDPPTTPLDEHGQGKPYASYGYGAQLAEVEVDTRLGTVRMLRVVAAHDVGRTINPTLAEGQVEGGIAQGIGMALMEAFVPGRSDNLHDYLIPTVGDVPEIETILIEETDALGPFGAKGLGEHVLIPTAPAILNAIRHACGARVCSVPATPERILAALGESPR